jgi:NhaA family Na+:H+ antiporter
MALFFLLVGLEIKREMLVGELATFQKAALPIAAALGGMLIPAILYWSINHSGDGRAGWGIPMATDIAFALGVITLLGNRVPVALRIFLAALAIADDIGAVLIIAFFYTDKLSLGHLGAAAIIFVALIACNRSGVRHLLVYITFGVLLWIAFLHSGIHATVAGVLLATVIPAGKKIDESPMLRFEHALVPWVTYLIMPIFALANAGISFGSTLVPALTNSIGLGIMCGLVLGKPIGITLFSWMATRIGWASLPTAVRWRQIIGVGALGGIGFTMSLFIANLAFSSTLSLETAKIGILAGSFLSGIGGIVILLKKEIP